MLNDPDKTKNNEPIEVRSYFVRSRNALAVRADFSTMYRDYYLHLMQHEIRYEAAFDQRLKDSLAALTLHLCSRPWSEAVAWTLSWQEPAYNLFVTGSNRQGAVTGRIFTEDIRPRDENLFIAQIQVDGSENRQSAVEARSEDFFSIVEDYHKQSEQRLARVFSLSEEEFVMLSAQPDCDLNWLGEQNDETIRRLDQEEELSLLETRHYAFDCGCSLFKLLPVLGSLSGETIDEVFGTSQEEPVLITCPRCGAGYRLTREMLEIYLIKQ